MYHEDLKRLGLSTLEQFEALEMTGHLHAYNYDIYAMLLMFIVGGVILYATA